MASVPYSPVPDVVPTAPAAPKIGIATPPQAFGITTAEAEQRLGGQAEQSGQELAQTALGLQQTVNETWAKDQFVSQSEKLGKIEEDFYSKKGAAAVAAAPQYAQDVKQLYEDAIANAPNAQAKRFLGDALSRRISYSLVDGQRHAGQQSQQYVETTNTNLVASGLASVAANPDNDGIFNQAVSNARSAARTLTNTAGEDERGYNRREEQFVSQLWQTRLERIGFNDPQRALKILDANENQIKGVTPQGKAYVETIREELQRRNNIVGADADADSILKNLKPDSGPDFEEKALKKAQEMAEPYGAEYKAHLIAQVKNKYNDFHNAYRQSEYGVFSKLSAEITGADGGPPVTERSGIFNNPVRYQLYESLGETATGRLKQEQLLRMVDSQSRRGSLDSDQQRALVDRIRGFAIEAERDPAARDEFYKMDWGDLYSKVDPGLKNTLSSEQDRVRKSWAKMGSAPGQDRAAEIATSVKPMMDSAGIKRDPNNKAANSQYFEFIGALTAKVQAQEAVTGKSLSDKDIADLAAPLVARIGGIGNAVKNNGGIGAPQASM